jgi:peptidoglycan/LPS O-acetylase OafA/YrhL
VFFKFRPAWDLSYGIYIIHFPVLQWLVSLGLFRTHPYLGLLLELTLVLLLASSSWLLIERPMQRRKAAW